MLALVILCPSRASTPAGALPWPASASLSSGLSRPCGGGSCSGSGIFSHSHNIFKNINEGSHDLNSSVTEFNVGDSVYCIELNNEIRIGKVKRKPRIMAKLRGSIW